MGEEEHEQPEEEEVPVQGEEPEEPEGEPAFLLYQFSGETMGALQREERRADDVKMVGEVLRSAQRLQQIVRQLTQQEQALSRQIAEDHRMAEAAVVARRESEAQRDAAVAATADAEGLLAEARVAAREALSEELDAWCDEEKRRRVLQLEEELHADLQRVETVSAQREELEAKNVDLREEHAQLARHVEVLRQTRAQLAGEIAQE